MAADGSDTGADGGTGRRKGRFRKGKAIDT